MRTIISAVVIVVTVCIAQTASAVKTHVHVVQVDADNRTGVPRPNVSVFYGSSFEAKEPFGITGLDGVAEGDIDPEKFGPDVTLFLVGTGNQEPVARPVQLGNPNELSKGFVVSLVPDDQRFVTDLTGTETWVAGMCAEVECGYQYCGPNDCCPNECFVMEPCYSYNIEYPCDFYCPPCHRYRHPHFRW